MFRRNTHTTVVLCHHAIRTTSHAYIQFIWNRAQNLLRPQYVLHFWEIDNGGQMTCFYLCISGAQNIDRRLESCHLRDTTHGV